MNKAACLGLDNHIFFCDNNECIIKAKIICTDCPVREPCFDYGLNQEFGIFGGTTSDERNEIISIGEKLFNQCLTVYECMNDESFEGVYSGHLTKLIINELGYPNPYYSKITKKLKDMECIQQIRRGNASAPSIWKLPKETSL